MQSLALAPTPGYEWVEKAQCHWITGGSITDLQEIKSLTKAVCALQPKIEAWMTSADTTLVTILQHNPKLSGLLKDGQLARETVEQLLKICQADADKQSELLYLTLQPMHYLLQPSVHLGPDMIGFLGMLQYINRT